MERKYDIILYGATGFTARRVITELEKSHYRIAVSARNISKIMNTTFDKIECSIQDIQKVTKLTRLLLNLTGPYGVYGEDIVRACIKTRTNYMDISGEVGFIRDTFNKFNEEARDNRVKIVQACGFDSIPADIGAVFLAKQFDSCEVQSVISVTGGCINITTWVSLLESIRKKNLEPHKSNSSSTIKCKNTNFHHTTPNKKISCNGFPVKFMGSDGAVVRRSSTTFRSLSLFNYSYFPYLNVGSFLNLILYYLIGFIIYKTVKYNFFYNLYRRYPNIFSGGIVSKTHPTDKQLSNTSFVVTFVANGIRNNKKLEKTLTISGTDPGYRSTAIFLTQSAYTMLEQLHESSDALEMEKSCIRRQNHDGLNNPNISFGVLTPAEAFYKTTLVDKLIQNGINWKME